MSWIIWPVAVLVVTVTSNEPMRALSPGRDMDSAPTTCENVMGVSMRKPASGEAGEASSAR